MKRSLLGSGTSSDKRAENQPKERMVMRGFGRVVFSLNPNGIPQQSPGLGGTSYPGQRIGRTKTPTGFRLQNNVCCVSQPGWCCWSWLLTQGSSFLPTLGFGTQSLWDWQIFKI